MAEDKASSFLAALRGAGATTGGGPSGEETLKLIARLEAMEKRLAEVAKSVEPPTEEAPPKPPTELMLFLQTRVEVLEQKLQSAQEEALRASLLLREREEAQQKAQREVEELFHSMREQTRAASWDAKLRDQFSASQARISELEAKLQLALEYLSAQDRAKLEQSLKEKASAGVPVSPEGREGQGEGDPRTLALLMGRIADLERRLEGAQKDRDQEKARRILWEKDILVKLSKDPQRWQKAGGSELVVEATLQSLVETQRQRDEAANEVEDIVRKINAEKLGSDVAQELHARLNVAKKRLKELQAHLEQQLSVIQAWLSQGKSAGK